jgi:hypothetical protein
VLVCKSSLAGPISSGCSQHACLGKDPEKGIVRPVLWREHMEVVLQWTFEKENLAALNGNDPS